MNSIPTLWFDKDGVLAQYDYSIYEAEYGAPAPWKIRNTHVFRSIDPYQNMCAAFKRIYKESADKPISERRCNIKVLTAVSDGLTLSEHVMDGMHWCKKNLELKERDFYACAVSKESIPVSLRAEITRYDILLDDYNPNLIKWKEAGGTAVKVVNGINSINKEFPWVHVTSDADYIYDVFNLIVDCITTEGKLPAVLAPKAK